MQQVILTALWSDYKTEIKVSKKSASPFGCIEVLCKTIKYFFPEIRFILPEYDDRARACVITKGLLQIGKYKAKRYSCLQK